MSTFDNLLTRNQQFAAAHDADKPVSPALPEALRHVRALVVGCADMRVDPSHVLGLKRGEAVVMRNVGGRITPGLLEQFALLGQIGQVAGVAPGDGADFHLIVLQHTDCGILRLADSPEMLAGYFQVPEAHLPGKAVRDPQSAVAADVALLRSIEDLPGSWLVSGLVYDVATGKVQVVVPPSPLKQQASQISAPLAIAD